MNTILNFFRNRRLDKIEERLAFVRAEIAAYDALEGVPIYRYARRCGELAALEFKRQRFIARQYTNKP